MLQLRLNSFSLFAKWNSGVQNECFPLTVGDKWKLKSEIQIVIYIKWKKDLPVGQLFFSAFIPLVSFGIKHNMIMSDCIRL